MFKVIKRFSDAGIRCAVNIDPIIPLITDSANDIESIVENCYKSGVIYVFGATLRLRSDIWERMMIILKMLNKEEEGIKEYKKLYHFNEPFKKSYNLYVDKVYSNTLLENLKEAVLRRKMSFDFPHLIGSRCIKINKSKENSKQLTLMNFV
jgi:DNA repair photolyase